MAAMTRDTNIAEPASPATMPVTTNIPAPMIAPTFMAVASKRDRVGLREFWLFLIFVGAP